KLATGPLDVTSEPPAAAAAPAQERVVSSDGAQASPASSTASGPGQTPNDQAQVSSASEAQLGTKARVAKQRLQTFESLYTMKAVTRSSVVVLGCPVEGVASNIKDEIRIGDVKALFFPAGESVELNIAAQEAGSFTLHVFVPARTHPVRFGPVSISPKD